MEQNCYPTTLNIAEKNLAFNAYKYFSRKGHDFLLTRWMSKITSGRVRTRKSLLPANSWG